MGEEESGHSAEAAFAMLSFSIASSSLLLINKLCMHYIPAPAFVSTLQFFCAAVTSIVLMARGTVASDGWEWQKVKPYLYYVVMFVCTIYANMRALQHCNVETVIVFRSACPLIVCVLDWAFLGRQLPSPRSVLSLLVITGGCAGYVLTDRAFELSGWGAYTWVTAYFCIISVEMAYGKHIVGPHLQFASMWGPTLYTNTLSVVPMMPIGIVAGEPAKLSRSTWSTAAILLLVTSCVIGVAISYLGWRARSLVTATCYTVLGVANKMFTVLANAMVWDQRASLTGMLFLVVCLVGAAGYKQAPLAEVDSKVDSHDSPRKRFRKVAGRSLCAVLILSLLGVAHRTMTMGTWQPGVEARAAPPSSRPHAHNHSRAVAQGLPRHHGSSPNRTQALRHGKQASTKSAAAKPGRDDQATHPAGAVNTHRPSTRPS